MACSRMSVLLGKVKETRGGELERARSLNPSLVSPPASAIHSHFQVQDTQARHVPAPPPPPGEQGGAAAPRSRLPEVPPLEGAEGEVGPPAPVRAKGSPRDSTPTRGLILIFHWPPLVWPIYHANAGALAPERSRRPRGERRPIGGPDTGICNIFLWALESFSNAITATPGTASPAT